MKNFGASARKFAFTGDVEVGTYEDLASEYYDSVRHPTCANFRDASAHFLRDRLVFAYRETRKVCEVGPGKSLVAELLAERGVPVDGLILIDSSPSMLRYSEKWAHTGAQLVIGDAFILPLASESVDLVVASLGDAYNDHHFWRDVERVLRTGGISLFTTPSYDWAAAFRNTDDPFMMTLAEFLLRDGRTLYVPSRIYPRDDQIKLVEDSDLVVIEVNEIPISVLESKHLSPKLTPRRGRDASIVTGYVIRKP